MNLLREITNGDDEATPQDSDREEKADVKGTDSPGPVTPDGWSLGHLANHGVILACDGFQLKMDAVQLDKFFDIAESGDIGEIKDQDGTIISVEPNSDSIILTRTNDKTYPLGVVLDLETLKDMGIEQDEQDAQDESDPEEDPENEGDDVTIDNVEEGIKRAYRRVGNQIKKGFRVTSGFRKGRVVSSAAAAMAPRAKASTRMKLKIAAKKHKFVRILKSKRTRKKSLSKRLRRMNHT